MKFHEKVQTLCKAKGFTQREVARKIGEDRSSVNRWWNGPKTPNIYQAIKIAKLLGVSLDFLADESATKDILSETRLATDEMTVLQFYREARKVGRGTDAIRSLAEIPRPELGLGPKDDLGPGTVTETIEPPVNPMPPPKKKKG